MNNTQLSAPPLGPQSMITVALAHSCFVHPHHFRTPFWWSVIHALQALEALGPRFAEFRNLLEFKTKRLDLENLDTGIDELLRPHVHIWCVFKSAIEVLSMEARHPRQWQQREKQQWHRHWFYYLNCLTEALIALGSQANDFYGLWCSHLMDSISFETLKERMGPLFREHDELWTFFQDYFQSQQRLQQYQLWKQQQQQSTEQHSLPQQGEEQQQK